MLRTGAPQGSCLQHGNLLWQFLLGGPDDARCPALREEMSCGKCCAQTRAGHPQGFFSPCPLRGVILHCIAQMGWA